MRKDQLLQVIAEWLREMVIPPSTRREMPFLDLRKQRAILAIAGPRRAVARANRRFWLTSDAGECSFGGIKKRGEKWLRMN